MDYILLRAPMHINWNFTYKCNFNCIHCYSRTRNDMNELSYDDKMLVAKNIVRNNIFNVNLGGGEPLLSEDCFPIIRYLSDHGVRVNLSTNGWKTSEQTVKKLKESGLGGIAISIDHIDSKIHDLCRNKEGSYEESFKAIDKYLSEDIDVIFSTVITSKNYECLEKIVEKGVSLGIRGIDFKRLKVAGNALNHPELELNEDQVQKLYDCIIKWKKKYPININLVYGTTRIPNVDAGCPCGKTSLAILCNGDISPCVYHTEVIGNATLDDLHDVWCHSERLINMRKNFSCFGLRKE